MKTHSVKARCESCGGTGLYQGFCEAKGEAVVCLNCAGTGWVTLKYKEYSGRVRKRGISKIRVSRGSFIVTGVGGVGESMTYAEFEKAYPED